MTKEKEKEIIRTTGFMSNEFLVELATGRFNFKNEEAILAEDMADYSDFSMEESREIAKQVMLRLRRFAKAIQTARAEATR
jgi:hypothetical protein